MADNTSLAAVTPEMQHVALERNASEIENLQKSHVKCSHLRSVHGAVVLISVAFNHELDV